MSRLILVRHAMPAMQPGVAATLWGLTDAAREDCVLLAHALDLPAGGPAIFSSPERKARETADVLALRLGRLVHEDAAFAEADRPPEWIMDHRARVAEYLAGCEQDGWEPKAAVTRRFSAGVERALSAAGERDAIVVSHGTAMTCFLASVAEIAPVAFWEALSLPDVWAFDTATGSLARLFDLPRAPSK